ncbi:type II secretion system protein [Polaromonas sp.]|uniref:type II secretion system protein n=1 Tax=Polaromonas sp. TaxID=1869339 RepID=UPI0027319D51|nr:type II secretion system protein [Polaromonas sp.]MDP1742337.1 type II secretion system protein [Polaromonas sp.]
MKTLKKQGGFTLVEIAIVLVIVGLLLAGVLKGQELIENSRIKNLAKDLDSMTAVVRSYQDRYRGVPGDDLTATTHTERGWGATAFTAGNNNGLIGAGGAVIIFPPAAGSENLQAFQALRRAGFVEGDPAATTLPTSAAGGGISLTNNVMGFGLVNVVCMSGLTGKQAGALDRLLDDGVNNTGNVRAAITATTPAVAAGAVVNYVEATAGFMVCKIL